MQQVIQGWRAGRLPRSLHPLAWWAWAVGMAVAVTQTTNPLLLLLAFAVVCLVVVARRADAPWGRALRYYLTLAGVVIVIRVVLRIVFGGGALGSDHILFRLPQLPLPHWAAGVQIGGPVSLESTLDAVYDGMRLGCLLCCIGAANAMANPRRALRVLPGALYELGVAVVVCVTVAPQLVESVQRVHRARRLRAAPTKGLAGLRGIAVPVLEDALDRSLQLAAAMDSRGYGRTGAQGRAGRRLTSALVLVGMLGLAVGCYGLLDGTSAHTEAWPLLGVGAATCVAGLAVGGRRVRTTTYRPDRWLLPEWTVAGIGVVVAATLTAVGGTDAAALHPATSPAVLPSLPLLPTLVLLAGSLAAVAAPPVPRSTDSRRGAAVREPAVAVMTGEAAA